MGSDFNLKRATANIAELVEQVNHGPELSDLRNPFIYAAASGDASIWSKQATTVVFAVASVDNGFGDAAIDPWDELQDGGRGGIDVEFTAGDGGEQIHQPHFVGKRLLETKSVRALLKGRGGMIRRGRTPIEIRSDSTDQQQFGKIIDGSVLGFIRRIKRLVVFAFCALNSWIIIGIDPVQDGIDNGGHFTWVDSREQQRLLEDGLVSDIDVKLPLHVGHFPCEIAMANVHFRLDLH